MEKLKSTKNQSQNLTTSESRRGIIESDFVKHEAAGKKSSSKVKVNSPSENRKNNSSNLNNNNNNNNNNSVCAITTRSSSFRSSTIAKRAKTEISTNNNSNVNSLMKSDKCSKYSSSSSGGNEVKPKAPSRRKQKQTHNKSDDERITESETISPPRKLDQESQGDKCESEKEFDGAHEAASESDDEEDNDEDNKGAKWIIEKDSMGSPPTQLSVNSNNNNLKAAEQLPQSLMCPTTSPSTTSGSSNPVTTPLQLHLRSKSNWAIKPPGPSSSELQQKAPSELQEGLDRTDMNTITMGVELKAQRPQSVHSIKSEVKSPSPSSSGSSSPILHHPFPISSADTFGEAQSPPRPKSSHSHFASNNNEGHKNSQGIRQSSSNLNLKTSSTAASVSSNGNGPTSTPNKNKHGSHNNNNNVEPSKIAPQNLMNNLPYMGELTFDTRPRRGRKPKKADICHLISKNYGIHFPNSYVNIPASSPTPRVPVPNLRDTTGTGTRDATSRGVNSGSRGAKNKSSSRSLSARQQNANFHGSNTKNISAQPQFNLTTVDPTSLHANLNLGSNERHRRPNNSSSNRRNHHQNHKDSGHEMCNDDDDGIIHGGLLPNWTHHVPPDLLPLASLNPEALFQHHQLQQQQQQAKNPGHAGSKKTRSNYQQALQQHQEQLEQFSRLTNDLQHIFPREAVRNPDEPLNLCVRDKEASHLNLLSATASINSLYSSSSSSPQPSGHVGKPSANNLFNNFNLRLNAASKNLFSSSSPQHGHQGKSPKSQQVQAVNKRGSSGGSGNAALKLDSSSSTNTDHNNIVSDDPNLVNLNLQLNLCASKLANSAINSSSSNRPSQSSSSAAGHNPNSSDPGMRGSKLLPFPPLGGNNNGKSPKGRRKRSSNYLGNNSVPSTSSSGSALPSYSHNSSSLYNLSCNPSNILSHPQSSHFTPNQSMADNNNSMEINVSPFASSPSNPAEVSICKFKFTGGAKPSLQEKKMLSVDSGGNFRFYSDKACSSSAQAKNSSGSGSHSSHMYHHQGSFKDDQNSSGELISTTHGLPKSAKSMSMCMPVPIPAMSTCSMISEIQSPSLPSMASPGELDCSSSSDGGTSSSLLPSPTGMSSSGVYDPCGGGPGSSSNNNNKMNKRKRRTRKSLMREKLEKTFKEKGFLIQTQQLESAEGATYCKFRQLRKFTRYLFRSWKDYLPDNLKGINPAAAGQVHMDASSMGLQAAMSSDNLSEAGMDHGMEQDGDDTECGSESPDNLTLSPSETHHGIENEQQDPDDDEDEMVDDT